MWPLPTPAGTVMARLVNPGADAALRTYLLTEARDFRRTYVETQLDDPAWRDYVWAETSMRVDQLANGQPGRISRYDCLTGIRREPSARSPTRCCWTRTTSSPRSIPTPVYGRRRRPAT